MRVVWLVSWLVVTFFVEANAADRVKWKEFEWDDARMFAVAGFRGKFDYTGTLRVSYSTDRGLRTEVAEAWVADRSYLLTLDFPTSWLKKQFPAAPPFEKDTYRSLVLDFKISSNGEFGNIKASASFKPNREVSLACLWGDAQGNRRSSVIKFSEDMKTATQDEVKGNGTVETQSSGKNGLTIQVQWTHSELKIKQRNNVPLIYDGTFKVENENREVTCDLNKND